MKWYAIGESRVSSFLDLIRSMKSLNRRSLNCWKKEEIIKVIFVVILLRRFAFKKECVNIISWSIIYFTIKLFLFHFVLLMIKEELRNLCFFIIWREINLVLQFFESFILYKYERCIYIWNNCMLHEQLYKLNVGGKVICLSLNQDLTGIN